MSNTGKGRRTQAGNGAGGALAEALTPLIPGMTAALETQPSQRLEALEVLALFLDGVVVARQTVIVALGLTRDGQKVPLGLRLGSTENAVGALMLHAQRGARVSHPSESARQARRTLDSHEKFLGAADNLSPIMTP